MEVFTCQKVGYGAWHPHLIPCHAFDHLHSVLCCTPSFAPSLASSCPT
jgi:hypothetical protein